MSDFKEFSDGAAGHASGFLVTEEGHLLKKLSNEESKIEVQIFDEIQATNDPIGEFTPHYYKTKTIEDQDYCEMENLLQNFQSPAVMDIKLGKRTFVNAPGNDCKREDLYEKMIKVDPEGPTEEEHEEKCVTKHRYLSFRDQRSTTKGLCCRIEGIKYRDSIIPNPDKKKVLQNISTLSDFTKNLELFMQNDPSLASIFYEKLKSLENVVKSSPVAQNSNLIGSSLLFIHDQSSVGLNVIDFGKTRKLTENEEKDDGYLEGISNLVSVFKLLSNAAKKN